MTSADVKEVSGKSFDCIVVGGGTAERPLAATLSERFSVLLVQRDGSSFENPFILEKKLLRPLTAPNRGIYITRISFISKDAIPNIRGIVPGGSSAISDRFYSRSSQDFVKKFGWDSELVKDAYKWVESRIVFKPELTIWQTVAEFSILEVGILPYNRFCLNAYSGNQVGWEYFLGMWKETHLNKSSIGREFKQQYCSFKCNSEESDHS